MTISAGDTPISIARERDFDDVYQLMTTYKYQPSVSMQEQQEATDSLMQEMEKDSLGSFKHSDVDISQDSTSCEDIASTTLHGNSSSSTSQQHNCTHLFMTLSISKIDRNSNFNIICAHHSIQHQHFNCYRMNSQWTIRIIFYNRHLHVAVKLLSRNSESKC